MPLPRSHHVVRSLVIVALLAASIALPRALDAQRPVPADGACTYSACALRLEGRRLVRGASGETVAKNGFFTPRPLLPFVTGDSARFHAARYERDARSANLLFTLGGLGYAGAFLAYQATEGSCASPLTGCDRRVALDVGIGIAVVGSLVAMTVGTRRGTRAARAEARALWWHNANFAR